MAIDATEKNLGLRGLVLFDVFNIIACCKKSSCPWRIEYAERFYEACSGPDRTLVRAIAFSGRMHKKPQWSSQNDLLKNMGYEVFEKEGIEQDSGVIKCNVDAEMSLYGYLIAQQKAIDVVTIISGDGDFAYLAKMLKESLFCHVEVIAITESTAKSLFEVADSFQDARTFFDQQNTQAARPTSSKQSKISLRKEEAFYRKKSGN